jgi:hypothetical protein
MQFEKGKPRPAGAGRKKGSKNKATKVRAAAVAATGITPLQYLLNILRDERRSTSERMWAAIQAAPYIHRKLAKTIIQTPPGRPLEVRITRSGGCAFASALPERGAPKT